MHPAPPLERTHFFAAIGMTIVLVIVCPRAQAQNASTPSAARVGIELYVVSDFDGSRRATVTGDQFGRWVEFANGVFRSAGLHFDFDASFHVESVYDTRLNNVTGESDTGWADALMAGNRVAATNGGRLAVLCRHGPGDRPTGGGFSWPTYNFVVMPGYGVSRYCQRPHDDALAHESGHYFGLSHTFAANPFPNEAAAQSFLDQHHGQVDAFDGDHLADTPPDPFVDSLNCSHRRSILLGGQEVVLPRRNVMSYYDERSALSPMQSERIRSVLTQRETAGVLHVEHD